MHPADSVSERRPRDPTETPGFIWDTRRMLVVRGTKKLRDRVKRPAAAEGDQSTGALGDWFATALFWKPQVALAVNARTFLPVFLPLAPATTLLERLPDEIVRILTLHGVDQAAIEAEQTAMSDVRIAPTNDRSVVGVMNEFAFLGEHFFAGDLTELSLRVAGTPVGPLREGGGFPDKALATILGMAPSNSEAPEMPTNVIPFPVMELVAAPATESVVPRVTKGVSGSVFQLKVTLLNTKPPVWRRVLVDSSTTLFELHEVIQAAFGWWNCHLHEFEIDRVQYGTSDPDWDFGPPTVDERTVQLSAVADEGSSFHYTYDFGDDWRHKVTIEKRVTIEPGTTVPACTGGRRACPPEDCGGPWGYQDLVAALAGDTSATDARLDYVGPNFDPAAFRPDDFAFNLVNVRNATFDF